MNKKTQQELEKGYRALELEQVELKLEICRLLGKLTTQVYYLDESKAVNNVRQSVNKLSKLIIKEIKLF